MPGRRLQRGLDRPAAGRAAGAAAGPGPVQLGDAHRPATPPTRRPRPATGPRAGDEAVRPRDLARARRDQDRATPPGPGPPPRAVGTGLARAAPPALQENRRARPHPALRQATGHRARQRDPHPVRQARRQTDLAVLDRPGRLVRSGPALAGLPAPVPDRAPVPILQTAPRLDPAPAAHPAAGPAVELADRRRLRPPRRRPRPRRRPPPALGTSRPDVPAAGQTRISGTSGRAGHSRQVPEILHTRPRTTPRPHFHPRTTPPRQPQTPQLTHPSHTTRNGPPLTRRPAKKLTRG